jgi:hypothetical protein
MWLIGPDNTFAHTDATDVDELAAHGWTPHPEPSGTERVWLRHQVTGATALFPHAALEPWQAIGWQHTVPATAPTDQGPKVDLDASKLAAETPAVTPPPADEAQTEKEARRGR